MVLVFFAIGLAAGIEMFTRHSIWQKVFGCVLVLATLGAAAALAVWFMLPSEDSKDA